MKDESLPAFPPMVPNMGYGMTKRELIAMHLMCDAPYNKHEHTENAKWAKDAADALLAELAKE